MSEQRCSACAAFAAVVLLLLPCSAPALEIPEAVREVIDRSAVTLVTGRTTARHSSGSGAVLTDDGLVITSAHVVGCTRSIKLVLAGRKKPLLAYPVAIDDGADLALLQLSFVPPDLSPIELAEEVPPPGRRGAQGDEPRPSSCSPLKVQEN